MTTIETLTGYACARFGLQLLAHRLACFHVEVELTTLEAQSLLRGLGGLNLIGGDVVEVSPPFDPSGNTALVGATMMYEILCVVAEAAASRSRGLPAG